MSSLPLAITALLIPAIGMKHDEVKRLSRLPTPPGEALNPQCSRRA